MSADGLLGLDVRHLVALKAVAEERSFGRAARRLGYTQSAVSQQIATLERAAGAPLFERPGGPRPISLTAVGSTLLVHAEAVIARLHAAQADIAALAAGDAGALRIGTYQSTGARLLPVLLRDFRESWPQVDVRLVESTDDTELQALVESGSIDVSFVVLPTTAEPLEAVQLMRDPYVLVVPSGSPLATRERSLTLSEIAALPLISYRSCRTTRAVEERLRLTGRDPEVVFRSDENRTVQSLAATGLGYALVPRLTVDASDPTIVVIDLGDRLPPRLIGLAWHRDRLLTPAAQAFVDAARTHCAGIEPGARAA